MFGELNPVKKERVLNSVYTLANAVELGLQVVLELKGEDFDTRINNETLTNEQISNLLLLRMKEKIQLKKVSENLYNSNVDRLSAIGE